MKLTIRKIVIMSLTAFGLRMQGISPKNEAKPAVMPAAEDVAVQEAQQVMLKNRSWRPSWRKYYAVTLVSCDKPQEIEHGMQEDAAQSPAIEPNQLQTSSSNWLIRFFTKITAAISTKTAAIAPQKEQINQ